MTGPSVFGGYKSEVSAGIDRKGYNLHVSGMPEATTYMTVAGASAFTLNQAGEIPAGAIVIDSGSSGTSGATSGKFNIATGAAGEIYYGVANDTREAGDTRPITLTWFGFVRLVAGSGGINAGDLLMADGAGYNGSNAAWNGACVVFAPVATNASTLLASQKQCFGKALTGASAGGLFEAFVNFAGI
jgi:hypothetical protein